MIYTGYAEVGIEWCYKNVISPFTRIYLIDRGSASVYMNQQEYRLKEGDMFIIPKFTYHEYSCPESMSHYYICFIDQLIGGRNLFEYANINYCPQASELDKHLMKRFLELNPHCSLRDADPVFYDNRPELFSINREHSIGELRMDIESSGILLLLFSRFLKQGVCSIFHPSTKMIQVFNHINNNLHRRIPIAELAEIMCVARPLHPNLQASQRTHPQQVHTEETRGKSTDTDALLRPRHCADCPRSRHAQSVAIFQAVSSADRHLPQALHTERIPQSTIVYSSQQSCIFQRGC